MPIQIRAKVGRPQALHRLCRYVAQAPLPPPKGLRAPSSRLRLGFPVVAHWEFYLWQKFSVFGEAGANVYLHPALLRGRRNDFVEDPGAWVVAAVGVRWRFGRTGSFVARLGLPYAAVGVSFEF